MTLQTRAKFMMVVAIIFVIYSILWGLAPYTAINLPSRFILDLADWPIDNLTEQFDKNTMWLSSIGAGLLAAISVLFAGIVVPAIKAGNTSITNTTIVAMIFWFILDSAGSIASGVASNVFFNIIYLILVLIPLIGIKKQISR